MTFESSCPKKRIWFPETIASTFWFCSICERTSGASKWLNSTYWSRSTSLRTGLSIRRGEAPSLFSDIVFRRLSGRFSSEASKPQLGCLLRNEIESLFWPWKEDLVYALGNIRLDCDLKSLVAESSWPRNTYSKLQKIPLWFWKGTSSHSYWKNPSFKFLNFLSFEFTNAAVLNPPSLLNSHLSLSN